MFLRRCRPRVLAPWALVAGTAILGFAATGSHAAIDVPPSRLPPARTAVIAQYGDHLTWVDRLRDSSGKTVSVVLDRTGSRTRALSIAPMSDLDLGPGPKGKPL